MAMPTIANTMWKARDTAIWERAARRSDMDFKLTAWGGGGGFFRGGPGVPVAPPRPPPHPPPLSLPSAGGSLLYGEGVLWATWAVVGAEQQPAQKPARCGA